MIVVLVVNHGSLVFTEAVTCMGTVLACFLAWKLVWNRQTAELDNSN